MSFIDLVHDSFLDNSIRDLITENSRYRKRCVKITKPIKIVKHYIETDAYFISLHAWYQKQKEADIITRILCTQFDQADKERKQANRLRNKTKNLNALRIQRNIVKRTFILITLDLHNHFDQNLLSIVFTYLY